MNTQILQRRLIDDAIDTASPARIVTMLYDRLIRDLATAEQAIGAGDKREAEKHLLHAQDIVIELRSSLDTDVWEGAEGLTSIYGYVLAELIRANVSKDAPRVAACRRLLQPLRDAWHTAAAGLAGS